MSATIPFSSAMLQVQRLFELRSAMDVAELLLSPHLNTQFLLEATAEPGPSMWIVNRSDVSTETLRKLTLHSIEGIAQRAREKLSNRENPMFFLSPPEDLGPSAEIPDFAIEDVLGHPLVDFEHILFFSNSDKEDVRASAMLSLTRRLLEHPPNWTGHEALKSKLLDASAKCLLTDTSAFARGYAARVPLLSPELVREAIAKESHPLVLGKLLQHDVFNLTLLPQRSAYVEDLDSHALTILVADSRWEQSDRQNFQSLLEAKHPNSLAYWINRWHLNTALA